MTILLITLILVGLASASFGAEKIVFDTKADWETYEAAAVTAYKAARVVDKCHCCEVDDPECDDCCKCAAYASGTTAYSTEKTRETDGKWFCTPCPDMDNAAYVSENAGAALEEDSPDWYPAE